MEHKQFNFHGSPRCPKITSFGCSIGSGMYWAMETFSCKKNLAVKFRSKFCFKSVVNWAM